LGGGRGEDWIRGLEEEREKMKGIEEGGGGERRLDRWRKAKGGGMIVLSGECGRVVREGGKQRQRKV